jgi:hypothetical protein
MHPGMDAKAIPSSIRTQSKFTRHAYIHLAQVAKLKAAVYLGKFAAAAASVGGERRATLGIRARICFIRPERQNSRLLPRSALTRNFMNKLADIAAAAWCG